MCGDSRGKRRPAKVIQNEQAVGGAIDGKSEQKDEEETAAGGGGRAAGGSQDDGAEALPAEIPDGKSIAVKKDKTFNSDKENLMKNFNRFSLLDRTWSITDGVAYNAEQVIIPDVKISEQYINDTFRKEDNKD